MRAPAFLFIAVAVLGCNKKDDAATAAKADPAPTAAPAPAPAPAAAPAAAPAVVVDVANLPGVWHIAGRPEVVWTFKDGGAIHIKTSITEYDGKYAIDGKKLTISAQDVQTKTYDLVEASPAKLAIKDVDYSSTTELVH